MQPLKRVSFKIIILISLYSTTLLFSKFRWCLAFFSVRFFENHSMTTLFRRGCTLGPPPTPLSCGCLSLLRLTFQAELFLQPCQILGLQIARPLQYAPSLLQLRA